MIASDVVTNDDQLLPICSTSLLSSLAFISEKCCFIKPACRDVLDLVGVSILAPHGRITQKALVDIKPSLMRWDVPKANSNDFPAAVIRFNVKDQCGDIIKEACTQFR